MAESQESPVFMFDNSDPEMQRAYEGAVVSIAENKALIRRYLEEVVNTGNVDRISDFISPDYIDRNDQGRGIEGAKRHVLGVRQTYPDLHVTVGQQIAEGEWVVTRVTGRGTHLGAWLGMSPTGKALEITGVNIDRVVNGRIVEHGGVADLLGPLLVMGAIRWLAPENPFVNG
jgi:predicted ester cyclase